MKFDFKQDLLPHLVAIVIFCTVTVLFFAPAIFEGKTLPQHDVIQGVAGAHELTSYRDQTGQEGLWTNAMFSGMPGYLIDTKYSGELTRNIHIALGLFLPHPYSLICISFLTCYIMLIAFGVRPWLSMALGIAFGLTGFSIIGLSAGHNSKIAAVAFMPLVLAGVHWAFSGKRLWGFAVTALALAMELRVNHLQITYYLLLILIAYGLSHLIFAFKENKLPELLKTVAILLLAAGLAIGANIGRLWSVMEYSQYSTRGRSELTVEKAPSSGLEKDYAFQYSNGIFEPLFLFIPNFFGGSAREDLGNNSNLEEALRRNGANRQQIKQQVEAAPAYWGDQPLTAPYYAGAIVVFSFILGLFLLENKYRIWLGILVLIALTFSWGSNFDFNDLVFDYLPGYNKFRSVTFAIIIVVLAMVLGGGLALEKLLASPLNPATKKKFWIASATVGGFALLCILFAGLGSYKGAIDVQLASYPDWYLNALRADRASLLRMDAIRSFVFIVLFVGVIWLLIKEKLSKILAYALLIVIVFIDMFGVARRFINSDSFVRKSRQSEFAMSEADQRILQDTALSYRVMNLLNPFNDAKTSYYHKSVGGYHGAKLGRYQELIERHIAPQQSQVISALQSGSVDFGSIGVLDMLNTKYFMAGTSARSIIPNPSANGNAWFVEDVLLVGNADEEINALNEMNTKTTAVIDDSRFGISDQIPTATGAIDLVEYKPDYLKYQSSNEGFGLAIFSEIYYPEGWVARIDGEEVPILRANYVLRALEIPEGQHVIEFEFKPNSYYVGNTLTAGFNILLILVFLGALGKSLYDRNKTETSAAM